LPALHWIADQLPPVQRRRLDDARTYAIVPASVELQPGSSADVSTVRSAV
jgi:hypothetical protein